MASGVPVGSDDDDPEGGGVEVEVISMWVSPEARGKGVGERLLGEIERWAVGRGVRRLRLSVVKENEKAIGLYRRCGLRETGERGDLAPDGKGYEVVMVKEIGGGTAR
jgi:ribosomal protein S18 acetylase RimI-like enzyme